MEESSFSFFCNWFKSQEAANWNERWPKEVQGFRMTKLINLLEHKLLLPLEMLSNEQRYETGVLPSLQWTHIQIMLRVLGVGARLV